MNARLAALVSILCGATFLCAQPSSSGTGASSVGGKLQFVVIISRHGVRSPTGKLATLNQYSAQPWPSWTVPAGYLTAHGFQLMTLFGTYDRELLASQGLLAAEGCGGFDRIRILADSDQRTRETGKALAQGIAPGCNVSVAALPEGTLDPLFHPVEAGIGMPNRDLAAAAILGRIGNQPQALANAYRPQLQKLDSILRNCALTAVCNVAAISKPASLFSIPSAVAPGNSGHLVEFRSPLSLASTITENFLLEYAEGMEVQNVGWGRVDPETLRGLLQLHVASEDITGRTAYIARAQASNLLSHVLASVQQAVLRHPVPGALSKPEDALLILVGHDTNLANIAGALGISWIIDGRRDDTPPGGALILELWQSSSAQAFPRSYEVRLRYTAQTLDQMRNSTPLSLSVSPESVPVFLPGCSRSDFSCDWDSFLHAASAAIDPAFVR